MNFEVIFCDNEEAVKSHIKSCEGKHIQQVVYSSYHDALTQICFGCKLIRTSLKEIDLKNKNHNTQSAFNHVEGISYPKSQNLCKNCGHNEDAHKGFEGEPYRCYYCDCKKFIPQN